MIVVVVVILELCTAMNKLLFSRDLDVSYCHLQWLVETHCFCSPLPPSVGQRRNPRLAGMVTGGGPQDKQPFMVAFFKANEVRFRSIRSAHKGRQSNRSKPQKTVQDALKAVEAATGAQTIQTLPSLTLVMVLMSLTYWPCVYSYLHVFNFR